LSGCGFGIRIFGMLGRGILFIVRFRRFTNRMIGVRIMRIYPRLF